MSNSNINNKMKGSDKMNTENKSNKKYYIALYNTESNGVMIAPNTPKGRTTLINYKDENTKAFRIGAKNIEDAYEVFKRETGYDAQLIKIVYPKNIPVCKEIEL